MHLEDIMQRNVKCVAADDTAGAAAKLMRDCNVGFLPVCDQNGRAIGVVTDRDIVIRCLADGSGVDTPISSVMSQELVTCSPTDRLRVVESKMRDHKKSRMLCVDAQGKPIGIISLSDLAQHERAKRIGRVLRGLTHREART
jgi:CBS domain-containing protein